MCFTWLQLHFTLCNKKKNLFCLVVLQSLNPWLLTEVKISGGFKLIYFEANGLPRSNVSMDVLTETEKELELFIGIFSLTDNFQRRMAVRRTWMQYPAVRSGMVAVRFFVGMVQKMPKYKFLRTGKIYVSMHPKCERNGISIS